MRKILATSLLSLVLLAPLAHAGTGDDGVCKSDNNHIQFGSPYSLSLDHGDVITRDDGKEMMRVTADGHLFIMGRERKVGSAEAGLLKEYVGEVHGLVDDAREVGRAGAALGLKVVGEVFTALFDGGLDDIQNRAQAQADSFEGHTRSLCRDIEALRATELKLRRAIPEMGPYLPMTHNVI